MLDGCQFEFQTNNFERFRYMYYSLSTEKNVPVLGEIFRSMTRALGEMRRLRKLDGTETKALLA